MHNLNLKGWHLWDLLHMHNHHRVQMQLIDPREKLVVERFAFSRCKISIRCPVLSLSIFGPHYFPHCTSRDGFPDSKLGRISRFPDLISGISRLRPLEHSCPVPVWPAGPAALAKPHFTPHCRVQSALLHSVHCCTPGHYTAHQFTILYFAVLAKPQFTLHCSCVHLLTTYSVQCAMFTTTTVCFITHH